MFPICAPPLVDGVVTIAGDRIVAVGENLSGQRAVDLSEVALGDVALLPGLVNPHTHLEFSRLAHPLGHPGMPLSAWILEVVAYRRRIEASAAESAEDARRAALEAGLQECLACGVTTVGDIVTAGLDEVLQCPAPIGWYLFQELRGQTAQAIAAQIDLARQHLRPVTSRPELRPALSPHAPYSTARELVAAACALSRDASCPVALHLAESREELQLLATGGGPLRDMLEQLGAWVPAAFARASAPRDYLQLLDTAHRSLVVHGNYLLPADWDYLAQRAARMAVVYCPRTHQYFGHEPYPLPDLLRRGVRVVVGTDSRASNPDLDLWQELQVTARTHPGVAPAEIVRMGTLNAAAALGWETEVGSLAPGLRADMALVRIGGHQLPTDPHETLFDATSVVCGTLSRGSFTDQRRQR